MTYYAFTARQETKAATELRELLSYDPDTGVFIWKARPEHLFPRQRDWKTWNSRFAGTVAGNVNVHGYRAIMVFRKLHYAHRIAWVMHTGAWPENQIDHINQQRDDNRICNLREVTNQENMKNSTRIRSNTSGATGVHWDTRRSRWVAQIKHDGRGRFLGYYTDFDEAVAARKAADCKYGFHPNHGGALK